MTRERWQGAAAGGREAGFALVLAMLCLMVLTFLGMTLATTTSTELQIATNYRWSTQAFYNAEAGLELGKRMIRQFELRELVGDIRNPDNPAEMDAPPGDWTLARPGPDGEPSRNWENLPCDTGIYGGGVGYGNVMDHPTFAAPMQNTSSFFGMQLNGTFTLWIRRKVDQMPDPANPGTTRPEDSETTLVLTAEGTAPYLGAQQLHNRAVRIMQAEVRREEGNDCGDYTGSQGSGSTGSGYSCDGTEEGGGVEGGDEIRPDIQ